jgi:hypothetical protein
VRLEESFGALRERPFRLLWSARATSAAHDRARWLHAAVSRLAPLAGVVYVAFVT